VLVIIADAALSGRLIEALHRSGMQIEGVSDTVAAWSKLSDWSRAPAVVIIDQQQGVRAVTEFCQETRRLPSGHQTLFVTVAESVQMVPEAMARAARVDAVILSTDDDALLTWRLGVINRFLANLEKNSALQRVLYERASRDQLTGLWNRTAILERLEHEIVCAKRDRGPLGILMLDVDHFKSINDTHGHLVGDAMLQELGRRMQSLGRRYDLVGRYGGDEFLAVLPGCDLPRAVSVARRLHQRLCVKAVRLPVGEIALEMSVGVTAWSSGGGRSAALIDHADRALYKAKERGRNRVESTRFTGGTSAHQMTRSF
jgi:diguanylate cyclase (GGDEF)-like protein